MPFVLSKVFWTHHVPLWSMRSLATTWPHIVASSDYFDVLDSESRPLVTEHEILRNLEAIVADADTIPVHEVSSWNIHCLGKGVHLLHGV